MRVLIVEDDEMLANPLMWVAEEQGDEAAVCRTGSEAIATAHEMRPDLVVVDMKLPDIEGTEVCRAVRADSKTQNTTIVAHSAFSDGDLRRRAEAAGCHDFFVKGLDFRNLLALFRELHLRHAATSS